MRKFIFLAILGVGFGLSANAFAKESYSVAGQPTNQCVKAYNGCKSACFAKKPRRRGPCLASCKIQFRQCG